MQGGASQQTQEGIRNGALVQRERELRTRAAHHPQQTQHGDERAAGDQRRLDYQLERIHIKLLTINH